MPIPAKELSFDIKLQMTQKGQTEQIQGFRLGFVCPIKHNFLSIFYIFKGFYRFNKPIEPFAILDCTGDGSLC